MKILMDSHIILWSLNNDRKLSPAARDLILDARNTLYFSVISVWEFSIKHAVHPDNVLVSGLEIYALCESAGYEPLDLCGKHVFTLETLHRRKGAPSHHDPFDRLLIAQAKAEKMLFLTHDSLLSYYDEPCIRII